MAALRGEFLEKTTVELEERGAFLRGGLTFSSWHRSEWWRRRRRR